MLGRHVTISVTVVAVLPIVPIVVLVVFVATAVANQQEFGRSG